MPKVHYTCVGLLCALLVGHNGVADGTEEDQRRLALTTFPGSTTLELVPTAVATANGQTVSLHAGVEYTQVNIDVEPSGSTFETPTMPMALFVPSTLAQAQARAGSCAQQAVGRNAVSAPYGGFPGESMTVVDSGNTVQSNSTLQFLMGGTYRLCYSDDGTFASGHGDTVNVILSVSGVFDDCLSDGCLTNKPYYCHVRKLASNPAGSCVLSYGGTGDGFVGSYGQATWSTAYSDAVYGEDGQLISVTRQLCTNSSDEPDEQYIGTDGVDRFITPTASSGRKEVVIPQTFATLSGANLNAFAVSACYCPNLGGCDAFEDFTQQIGVIYFFLSKICFDETCALDYQGVLAKIPFLVKVECPPGACSNTNSSRIKIVDAAVANSLPHWSTSSGCRTALHHSDFIPFGNCQGATDCEFNGGLRQDFKVFPDRSELGLFNYFGDNGSITYNSERYDLRTEHAAKLLDVCFCDADCSDSANWFNAGQFRTSPLRLVGHSALSQAGDIASVGYALLPGILGFSRPDAEANSLGLHSGGVLKILSDNNLTMNDALCSATPYDGALVAGPSNASSASTYAGAVDANSFPQRLVFNSGFVSRTLTVNSAGVIALCYCANTANGQCASGGQFTLVARLTVRGPAGGQVWQFSTNIISRISYSGWGLEASNTLRIILASASCSDNNGNPTSQDPAVHVGCPGNCKPVSNFPGEQTEITTHVVAHDKVGCDSNHAGCRTVFLTDINTNALAASGQIQESATQLTFSADPSLENGDVITLGSQISGGTAEQLATMRGVFPYADAGTYIVGLPVTRLGTAKYRVPLGWIAGSTPSFSISSNNGQWTRHNKGTTKEELLSFSERRNLKICWSPGASSVYTAEVGTISFLEPAAMSAAAVNLVSPIVGQSLPVIVSFETGPHSQYSSAMHSTHLRFLFTTLDFVQVDFADGSNLQSTQAVTPASAKRSVCGKFFQELWSSDGRGFPYPKSCYYGAEFSVNSVKRREVVVVFEPQSGLAPTTKYQAVLSATVRSGISAGDEVVQLSAMDDEVLKPYQAIEFGSGKLSRTPMPAASGASPQLASLELEGINSLLTLDNHRLPLEVKLSGSTAGPVVAGAHLRFIFRPLTLWNLSATCVATCTPAASGQLCGEVDECVAEAVVADAARNIAHLKLPQDLTPITGAVAPKIALWGLSQPDSGFFPLTLAVQVTDVNDLSPQFKESTGAYLYKQPSSKGYTVASVVLTDGSSKPFRGSSGNDIFLRIAFGTTLFSKTSDEAYFLITLPSGYTCVSASGVEASLGILDLEPNPQRRGTLSPATVVDSSDGAWKFNGNTCTYYLWQDSAIYAGTIVYIKLTVNNPSSALPASEGNNQLKLSLHSRGAMSFGVQAMPEVTFSSPPTGTNFTGSLSSSVSVLGKLSEGLVQPMDFTTNARHYLQIFFRTEQSAEAGAYIQLDAPNKFDFGASCVAGDLSDGAVYVLGVVPVTKRLPGIVGCTGTSVYSNAGYYNRAVIQTEKPITAQSRYAFQVAVTNPAGFSSEMLSSWRLEVLTPRRRALDKTEGPLHFQPSATGGWGLYQKAIDTSKSFTITLSSYKPYALTGLATTASIFPIRVSAAVVSKLRVIAPYGYTWIVDSSTASYRKAGSGTGSIQGATADLPGGLPMVTFNGSTLEWVAAAYDPGQTYGFSAQIRVPDTAPPISTHSFFIELGDWASGNIADRYEAGIVNASDVQALQDASVIPAHTGPGAVNVTLQIRTITSISQGGGLSITVPQGFDVPTQCAIIGSLGGSSSNTCSATKGTDGTTEVSIASAGSISPGTYRFKLTVTNPSPSVNVESSATSCGYAQCWIFRSLGNVANSQSVIDRFVATPSYSVYSSMPSAGLAELSEAQRLAIQQDKRPTSLSHLVFFFELAHDVTVSSNLRLIGPSGFAFYGNCLDGVETKKNNVFGGPLLWPNGAGFEPWPDSVNVTKCEGNANVAVLQVQPGLKAQKKYPWRVQVRSTPMLQPTENNWTVEYNGESSLPFSSFDVWTFRDVGLRPLTLAQSSPVPLSAPTVNVIVLQFRPYSRVSGGRVRLDAPPGFKFVHDKGLCDYGLKGLANDADGSSYLFNGSIDFMCSIDVDSELVLFLDFASGVVLNSSSLYELTMQVQNPSAELLERIWMLQSFQSQATSLTSSLDMARVTGFPVVQIVPTWSVVAVPSAGSSSYNKGLLPVKLRVRVTSPSELKTGDAFMVTGPLGFNVSSNQQGRCNQFTWAEPLPYESGPMVEKLQTDISCASVRGVEIVYIGSEDVAVGSHIAFQILTTNPRQTPAWTSNFWSFEHRRGMHVLAAGLSVGYNIIPQLEDIVVTLLGPLYAAQATSSVQVRLRVVSDCDLIRITAAAPAGFDLQGATLDGAEDLTNSRPASLSAISGAANVLDVQLHAVSDQLFQFRFGNVVLATSGGATQWTIQTFSAGVLTDEHTVAGFRLPGLISVVQKTLKNELASELSPPPRAEDEVALLSKWTPRVRSPAVVEFTVRLTNSVPASAELRITTNTDYRLRVQDVLLFPYNATGYQSIISLQALSPPSSVNPAIAARVSQSLSANVDYVMQMLVSTANGTAPGMWHIELLDGGALPVQTNDNQTAGFELAEIFDLQVSAEHAPPAADFRVNMSVNVGNAKPTVIRVVAPGLYGFPGNCTAIADMQCMSASINGVTSAYLSMQNGSAFSGDADLKFVTSSPPLEPISRTWVVEGLLVDSASLSQVGVAAPETLGRQLGWGENRLGFLLTPLSGIAVHYAAVPLISTCLSISFPVQYRGATQPSMIRITPPVSYRLSCDPKCLRLVSLPEENATCKEDPLSLSLQEGAVFPEGSHIFTVSVRVPSDTPQYSDLTGNFGSLYFQVLLLDRSERVIDSNMKVASTPVQSPALQLDRAFLAWTSSSPGQEALVHFGFRVKRSLPAISSAAQAAVGQPLRVAAILLEMPQGFRHMISAADGVRSLNSEFPLLQGAENTAGQWAQYDTNITIGSYFTAGSTSGPDLSLLRILRDETQRVPVGKYEFSLPVQIPLSMPRNNVWHLSLCSSVTCSSIDDANVVVSFVIPGFKHGEDSLEKVSEPGVQSLGTRAAFAAGGLAMLVFLHSNG